MADTTQHIAARLTLLHRIITLRLLILSILFIKHVPSIRAGGGKPSTVPEGSVAWMGNRGFTTGKQTSIMPLSLSYTGK